VAKVRILAPFPPPFGGVALHSVRLIEGLRHLGVDVEGISLGGIPSGVGNISKLGASFFFQRSLVHYHTDEGNHRWMRLLSAWWRLTHTPYVVTVHSFRDRIEFADERVRRQLASAYSHAAAVIGISNEVISDLEQRIGVRHKRTRVIPSSLPVSAWELDAPSTADLPPSWHNASVRILANAGRVVRYQGEDLYGIDVLLAALEQITDSDLGICIAIGDIVDVDLWSHLESLAQRDPRISLVRNLQGPLAPIVREAHIVVRPTRTEGGPSLTVQEALELGRWAVASDAVHRPDGTRLFQNANHQALADVLKSCISDVRRGAMPPAQPSHIDAVQRIANVYERVSV
jgi:glycosyltransferase involved in cell wall biosynthesis